MTFQEREKLFQKLNLYSTLLNKRKDAIIQMFVDKYQDDDCADLPEMIYQFLIEDPKYNDFVIKADKICLEINAK